MLVEKVMGKVNKENKRMTEVTSERRKNVTLKRSKSVRASLRMIGNRFLHHNKNHQEKLPRSPSLQSVFFERQQVETILKTPQPETKIRSKKTDGFCFTQPPSVIAPKAAAVLQIPNETVYYRGAFDEQCRGRHSWFLHKNWRECDLQGRFAELMEGNATNGNFYRGSLRLSITAKKRHGGWNSSFSSTSSR